MGRELQRAWRNEGCFLCASVSLSLSVLALPRVHCSALSIVTAHSLGQEKGARMRSRKTWPRVLGRLGVRLRAKSQLGQQHLHSEWRTLRLNVRHNARANKAFLLRLAEKNDPNIYASLWQTNMRFLSDALRHRRVRTVVSDCSCASGERCALLSAAGFPTSAEEFASCGQVYVSAPPRGRPNLVSLCTRLH
jgi:hypothetical protein